MLAAPSNRQSACAQRTLCLLARHDLIALKDGLKGYGLQFAVICNIMHFTFVKCFIVHIIFLCPTAYPYRRKPSSKKN